MNTSDIVIGKTHLALFKGGPGTGKSIAAHSYPQPSFTFDLDRKMEAVASRYPKKKFEYQQYDNIFDVLTKAEELESKCPYATVILDTWGSFARLALESVLNIRKPNAKKIIKGNIEFYQIEDYNAESRAVERMNNSLQRIYHKQGVNVITTVHIIKVVTYNIVTGRDETHEGLYIPGGKIAFSVPIIYNESYKFTVGSDITTGDSSQFYCETTGPNETKTVLKIPEKINWTKKNFYETIISYHEKESRVINF